jgi:hypothetical protein
MSTLSTIVCVAAGVAGWALAAARAEEPARGPADVGAKPGGFALNDQDGRAVRLGHGKDHRWFVLAFFPKASTGG